MKTSKLRVTGLCVGNSPLTGEFPAQIASNAENVSIWWRHHDYNSLIETSTKWPKKNLQMRFTWRAFSPTFEEDISRIHFLKTSYVFDYTELFPWWSKGQSISIGSCNGLEPINLQANHWTNNGSIQWRFQTSSSPNEFKWEVSAWFLMKAASKKKWWWIINPQLNKAKQNSVYISWDTLYASSTKYI